MRGRDHSDYRGDCYAELAALPKMAANEASAVASLRTLNTVIVEYSITYATDPSNLSSLQPATTPSSTSADLVDSLLGKDPAVKSGYSIAYTAVAGTPITSYSMVATPTSSSTGQRKFFTDQSGVIRQTTDGSTTNGQQHANRLIAPGRNEIGEKRSLPLFPQFSLSPCWNLPFEPLTRSFTASPKLTSRTRSNLQSV